MKIFSKLKLVPKHLPLQVAPRALDHTQIHRMMKQMFVNSFTHARPKYHHSAVSQPWYQLICISQDLESAVNKSRSNNIRSYCSRYCCFVCALESARVLSGNEMPYGFLAFLVCLFLTPSHIMTTSKLF